MGGCQYVPADDRRDRLVHVDDVELPGAQLAAQRRDGRGRRREVGDGAVGRPADRGAERDQPLGRVAALGAGAPVQPGGAPVVVVVRREHAYVVPGHEQLAGERLDVAGDPAGVRPRIGRDEGDPH
jgi:hypothetical protein